MIGQKGRSTAIAGMIKAVRSRLAARGVLRNHAEAVLAEVYAEAIERAAAETGLTAESFPAKCPYTLEQLLSPEFPAEAAPQ